MQFRRCFFSDGKTEKEKHLLPLIRLDLEAFVNVGSLSCSARMGAASEGTALVYSGWWVLKLPMILLENPVHFSWIYISQRSWSRKPAEQTKTTSALLPAGPSTTSSFFQGLLDQFFQLSI